MGLDELIDRVYEAAAFPDLWPSALNGLAELGDSVGSVAILRSGDQWTGWKASAVFEGPFQDYLQTDINQRSLTTRRLIERDWAGFTAITDIFTPEEWELDPLRAEFCLVHGWDQATATAIPLPTGDMLVFHVQRALGARNFDQEDHRKLDLLRPHLARAGVLAARWRLERMRVATEALALVGLAALVVDYDGRVLAANELIQGEKSYINWLPGNRIAFFQAQANSLFRDSLHWRKQGADRAAKSFAVRARNGENPAVVHVIPISGQSRDLFDGAGALILLTPLNTSPQPAADLIRTLFDLTPAEAQTARSLLLGGTIDSIANSRGIGRETIRSQLKSVLAKTGVKRQAELTTLLAGIPVWPQAED